MFTAVSKIRGHRINNWAGSIFEPRISRITLQHFNNLTMASCPIIQQYFILNLLSIQYETLCLLVLLHTVCDSMPMHVLHTVCFCIQYKTLSLSMYVV